MKTIDTKCFGIVVELSDEGGGGSISSDLHDENPDISNPSKVMGAIEYTAAINAIESLILAHACAGIDITTPAYLEGIETAVEACDRI